MEPVSFQIPTVDESVMTCGTEREKHCSVSDLGCVGSVHDGNQWIVWGTYDSEPEDDLDCLLLFRARSLSPWVTPFRSSSSLYCKDRQRQLCWGWQWAGVMLWRRVGSGRQLTSSSSCFLGALFLLLPLMLMSSTPDRILVTPVFPFSHSFCIFSRKTCPSAHRLFCFLIPITKSSIVFYQFLVCRWKCYILVFTMLLQYICNTYIQFRTKIFCFFMPVFKLKSAIKSKLKHHCFI